MSILVSCPTCQRRLQAKDEQAGKRIRCPGCGTVVIAAVEAAPSPPPASIPAPEPEAADEPRERKRRKRRKRTSELDARPLFQIGSVEFTPLRTLIFGGAALTVVVAVVLLFVFTPLGSMFSSEPQARFVDVYTAVNSVRNTDLMEYALQTPATMTYVVPGHRKVLVTRDNPSGSYIVINVNIPNKEVEEAFKGARGELSLSSNSIQIDGDNGKVNAMYVQDRRDDPVEGFHLAFIPPLLSGGGMGLPSYLGPKPDGWTHDGEKKGDADSLVEFVGKGGMHVKTKVSQKRLDQPQGKTHKAESSKAASLVACYLLVTWDKDSTGWLVADDHPQPNNISLSWAVTCFFPRPKNMGKELTLYVLGKPQTIKVK